MKVQRTGTILYVKNYLKCVNFYSNILDLSILFQNEILTCFDFYGTYLMVEIDDRETYLDLNPNDRKIYNCIRINVEDVKACSEQLRSKNVDIDYQEHTWGKVARFHDPDGNLIAFKDEESFLLQLANKF